MELYGISNLVRLPDSKQLGYYAAILSIAIAPKNQS